MIKWSFRYVPDGQMEPDEYGRWACVGYVPFKTKGYFSFAGRKGWAKIAWISKIENEYFNFSCRFCHYSDVLNTGANEKVLYAKTLEDMQKQVQEQWDINVLFFKNLI